MTDTRGSDWTPTRYHSLTHSLAAAAADLQQRRESDLSLLLGAGLFCVWWACRGDDRISPRLRVALRELLAGGGFFAFGLRSVSLMIAMRRLLMEMSAT